MGEQWFLVENAAEFQCWGVAVRLAEASEATAAHDTGRALQLARLARRVAELADLGSAFRPGLEGYLDAFFANTLRVGSDLPGAKAAFQHAGQLWEEGGAAWAGLLPAWRLPDLEASLCRDQRCWAEALALLDRAQALAPPEDVGRVLLKRSSVLVLLGEGDAAAEALRAAAPMVDGRRDPRLLSVLRFNLAATLVLLERYAEAAALLPEVRELALGNELDLVRCRWLEGQVAAGHGRREEARAAFEQVLLEFNRRAIAYDAALVALELSVLYLEEGRTAAVRHLAQGMAWIFDTQGVDEETRKALAVFREAAEREAVTAALARSFRAQLTRARMQPGED
jgi:tetratricopeptide (TPR) repeat protein